MSGRGARCIDPTGRFHGAPDDGRVSQPSTSSSSRRRPVRRSLKSSQRAKCSIKTETTKRRFSLHREGQGSGQLRTCLGCVTPLGCSLLGRVGRTELQRAWRWKRFEYIGGTLIVCPENYICCTKVSRRVCSRDCTRTQ